MSMFIGPGVIGIFFCALWAIKYPTQYADALFFRDKLPICFGTWLITLLASGTIAYFVVLANG